MDDPYSDDHTIATPVYDHLAKAEAVVDRRWTKKQRQYLVRWAATACRDRYIRLHKRRGLIATSATLDNEEKWSLVTWEPRLACAKAI